MSARRVSAPLDDDVGVVDEIEQLAPARRRRQVDRHDSLVRWVQPVVERRRLAGPVWPTGTLHLHHLGTRRGQDSSCQRAGPRDDRSMTRRPTTDVVDGTLDFHCEVTRAGGVSPASPSPAAARPSRTVGPARPLDGLPIGRPTGPPPPRDRSGWPFDQRRHRLDIGEAGQADGGPSVRGREQAARPIGRCPSLPDQPEPGRPAGQQIGPVQGHAGRGLDVGHQLVEPAGHIGGRGERGTVRPSGEIHQPRIAPGRHVTLDSWPPLRLPRLPLPPLASCWRPPTARPTTGWWSSISIAWDGSTRLPRRCCPPSPSASASALTTRPTSTSPSPRTPIRQLRGSTSLTWTWASTTWRSRSPTTRRQPSLSCTFSDVAAPIWSATWWSIARLFHPAGRPRARGLAGVPAGEAAAPEPAAPITLARYGSRLIVTLSRPHVRNAYSAAMRDALREALTVAVIDDTITAVRLLGAGTRFL